MRGFFDERLPADLAPGERLTYTLPSRETVVAVGATPELGIPVELQYSPEVRKGEYHPGIRYFYVWRDCEVQHLLDWIEPLTAWGYDTETSGISVFTEQVATIQFGHPLVPDPRAYTVDWRGLSEPYREKLRALIRDRKRRKIGANLKFEALYAEHRLGAPLRGIGWDTQVCELVVRAGLLPGGNGTGAGEEGNRRAYGFVGMAKCCARYLELDIDKDQDLRTSFYTTPIGRHSVRQVIYASSDTIYPFYIAEAQKKEVDARGLRNTCKVEFEIIPVLATMELTGMAFDKPNWVKLYQEAVTLQQAAEAKLDTILRGIQGDLFDGGVTDVRPLYHGVKRGNPEPINYSSSAQVKWVLKQVCAARGWPVKLLTTVTEVRKAKLASGRAVPWLVKRGKLEPEADAVLTKLTDELLDEVPDYVLPEEQFCILLEADWKTLTLRKIRKQLPEDVVDLLVDYADQKARLGTFGIDFLKNVHADGRVRFEFHQAITSTGRLSASPNSMNIPQDQRYRNSFVATPGWKLVIADYSQQEPRTSAYVSGDPIYRKTYELADDLYLVVAEAMLGYRPDPDSPDPEFAKRSKRDRKAIKAVVLGMAYKMGPGKLRDSLTLALDEPVTFEQAAELHRLFIEKCSGIKAFQDLCFLLADPESETSKKLWDVLLDAPVTWIASPCGRKRFFPPDAKSVWTESCNMPIQGCGATMTKTAMILIQRWIDDHQFPARPVNVIHDELVYECVEERAAEFALVVKAKMEEAGALYVKEVPIIASFPKHTDGTCDRWLKE